MSITRRGFLGALSASPLLRFLKPTVPPVEEIAPVIPDPKLEAFQTARSVGARIPIAQILECVGEVHVGDLIACGPGGRGIIASSGNFVCARAITNGPGGYVVVIPCVPFRFEGSAGGIGHGGGSGGNF